MTKKEAIEILIGNAVCSSPELHCDTDCPFAREIRDCKYVEEDRDFELKEAVKMLRGGLKDDRGRKGSNRIFKSKN